MQKQAAKYKRTSRKKTEKTRGHKTRNNKMMMMPMPSNGSNNNNNKNANSNNIQRERQIQLRNILQQIESLRKRIEDVYKKDEKIDVDSKDLLSSFRVVSKHLDELTNKIMYNPKNARSDDYSRVNLRHEIIAPNVPDLNLLNVFDSNIHNKNQIFPHQDVNSNNNKKNDVNTILQIEHNKRDVYNKSINTALKYLDNIVNPDSDIESSEDEDDL